MISIIIPTLNEEEVIESTLRNIKEGFENISHEIIISDGNSTDKTVEISKKYTDKILIYEGKEKTTIAKNRNAGSVLAKGEYLLFLDADVQIQNTKDSIDKILKLFDEDKNLYAVSISQKVFPKYETLSDKIILEITNILFVFFNNFLHHGRASGKFQMMRTDVFKEIGGYNENLTVTEDIELFRNLSKIGKTRFLKDLFFYYTGRRAHKIGWPKLLLQWWINDINLLIFKKSFNKEWTPIKEIQK